MPIRGALLFKPLQWHNQVFGLHCIYAFQSVKSGKELSWGFSPLVNRFVHTFLLCHSRKSSANRYWIISESQTYIILYILTIEKLPKMTSDNYKAGANISERKSSAITDRDASRQISSTSPIEFGVFWHVINSTVTQDTTSIALANQNCFFKSSLLAYVQKRR